MIAGLTEPTDGTIKIRGQNMIGVSPNKSPVNLIFQNLALFPMMDVRENMAFGLSDAAKRKSSIEGKVEAILERVDLAGFGEKKNRTILRWAETTGSDCPLPGFRSCGFVAG